MTWDTFIQLVQKYKTKKYILLQNNLAQYQTSKLTFFLGGHLATEYVFLVASEYFKLPKYAISYNIIIV